MEGAGFGGSTGAGGAAAAGGAAGGASVFFPGFDLPGIRELFDFYSKKYGREFIEEASDISRPLSIIILGVRARRED